MWKRAQGGRRDTHPAPDGWENKSGDRATTDWSRKDEPRAGARPASTAAVLSAAGKKEHFDKLHLRKIDLSDRVLVCNIGGYIGESTRNEIEYARKIGVPVRFLEPPRKEREMAKCRGCGNDTTEYEAPGLGMMHWLCEIERLSGLYEESEAILADLQCENEALREAATDMLGLYLTHETTGTRAAKVAEKLTAALA